MEYIVHDRFLMQCIPTQGDTEIIIPQDVIGLGKVHIPRGLKSIEFATFFGCHLSDVIIPDGVESIAANAFGYMYLNNVYFPESVKWIETKDRYESFWHMRQLKGTTFHVYKGSYMEQVAKKEKFNIKYR